MYCGLDFGTSNSSIGSLENGRVTLYKIDGDSVLMPSCIFALKKAIEVIKPEESEVRRVTDLMFREQRWEHRLNPSIKLQTYEDIEKLVRESLTRDANLEACRRYKEQGITSLDDRTNIIVGSEALRQHALYPSEGIFSKSPKSFLASDISPIHLHSFQTIVSRMLSRIKEAAEAESGKVFESVLLGRPVNYSPVATDAGNRQAMDIMRRAAGNAGFKKIEFELEPVAAALHFERTLAKETLVLIVDIGNR